MREGWDGLIRVAILLVLISSLTSDCARQAVPRTKGGRKGSGGTKGRKGQPDRRGPQAAAGPGYARSDRRDRAAAGPYFTDLNDAAGDATRTRYVEAIIRRKHVRFISVHLAALDYIEHEAGPYSPAAFAALEEIDQMVAAIEKAMRQETPETAICIASDHGLAPISHQLNLRAEGGCTDRFSPL